MPYACRKLADIHSDSFSRGMRFTSRELGRPVRASSFSVLHLSVYVAVEPCTGVVLRAGLERETRLAMGGAAV